MGKTHVDSLVRFKLFKDFVGEFDPGSGRTLAVRLMHASRAKLFSSLLQKMTTISHTGTETRPRLLREAAAGNIAQ